MFERKYVFFPKHRIHVSFGKNIFMLYVNIPVRASASPRDFLGPQIVPPAPHLAKKRVKSFLDVCIASMNGDDKPVIKTMGLLYLYLNIRIFKPNVQYRWIFRNFMEHFGQLSQWL